MGFIDNDAKVVGVPLVGTVVSVLTGTADSLNFCRYSRCHETAYYHLAFAHVSTSGAFSTTLLHHVAYLPAPHIIVTQLVILCISLDSADT